MELKLAYFVAIMIPNKRSVGLAVQLQFKKSYTLFLFFFKFENTILGHFLTLQPKTAPSFGLLPVTISTNV